MSDWLRGFDASGAAVMLIQRGNRQIGDVLADSFVSLKRAFDRWLANRRQDSRRLP
jgi:hypothetical protein